MASKFSVTPRTLRAKADELEGLNRKFKAEVESLRNDNSSLGTKWEGDARNKFNEEFLKDAVKFDQFSKGIDQFIQQLRTDADEYDKVENKNLGIASTRKS